MRFFGKICMSGLVDDEYFANSRTLDLHVQRLRKKLGWEKNLVAVYKVGYRLEL